MQQIQVQNFSEQHHIIHNNERGLEYSSSSSLKCIAGLCLTIDVADKDCENGQALSFQILKPHYPVRDMELLVQFLSALNH